MLEFVSAIRRSIAAKLIVLVGLVLLISLGIWVYFNINYQKKGIMQNVFAEADWLSHTVELGTHYAMLHNLRDDITLIIKNIAKEKKLESIRIYNKNGQIKFSNTPAEVDQITDIKAEACYICHRSDPPLEELSLAERTRIFSSSEGYRLLGIISPIYSEPQCSSNICHAHPQDKKVLGALDLVISLKQTDKEIALFETRLVAFAVFLFLVTASAVTFFVLRFVKRPIKKMINGTHQIADGRFVNKIDVDQADEMDRLSFAIGKMGEKIGEKQAELEKSEKKYYAIFDNIPNPVFVLDMESLEILDCNTSVEGVYGYKKDEIFKRSFLELFRPEEQDHYKALLKTTSVINQVRHLCKNGRTLYVNIRISPSEYPGKKVYLVTTSDITPRLETEQQLVQASKMATLGEMATGVAHELNQPLSVIKTASRFFIKKIHKKEKIADDVLLTMSREIDSHVDRATKIINHMRQFGRQSDITLEKVQINETVKKALEILGQQLKVRGIEVIRDLEPDLPLIQADPDRLEQVFINLLINARDAIDEKWRSKLYRKGEKQITLKTQADSQWVSVTISDTGPGIPDSIMERIFEPFFTTKKVGQGTGLGLSISYGIIRDLKGSIRAFSRKGKGASFVIKFPSSA